MKALSIQQPYAWLIVNGFKDIENRSWPTQVRGTVLIHAGKKMDEDAFCYYYGHFPMPLGIELGGIVGQVDIVDCVRKSKSTWFQGPYGFVLANPKPLPFRPCRGQLYFFEVDDE